MGKTPIMGSVYLHQGNFAHIMSFGEVLEPTHMVHVSNTLRESKLMIELENVSQIRVRIPILMKETFSRNSKTIPFLKLFLCIIL
jgi:hypothetical protein